MRGDAVADAARSSLSTPSPDGAGSDGEAGRPHATALAAGGLETTMTTDDADPGRAVQAARGRGTGDAGRAADADSAAAAAAAGEEGQEEAGEEEGQDEKEAEEEGAEESSTSEKVKAGAKRVPGRGAMGRGRGAAKSAGATVSRAGLSRAHTHIHVRVPAALPLAGHLGASERMSSRAAARRADDARTCPRDAIRPARSLPHYLRSYTWAVSLPARTRREENGRRQHWDARGQGKQTRGILRHRARTRPSGQEGGG